MYVALGRGDAQTQAMEERFEKFIAEASTLYDLVFLDCHPAGSLFTKTSLRNSDHVLIPVMLQRYAVRGIGLMMNFIAAKKAGIKAPTRTYYLTARHAMAPRPRKQIFGQIQTMRIFA
jgi:chromosome partitioning protein